MPINLDRIEGGVASGGTLTYLSPDGFVTHIQCIYVMNPEASVRSFSMAVVPAGAALTSPDHYIYWNVDVDSGETLPLTSPIILGSGDQIVFEDPTNELVFSLFGEVRN